MTARDIVGVSDKGPEPLPFSLDEVSFSNWFLQVEKGDKLESLQLLTDTLKQLKLLVMPADLRALFLVKISAIVIQFSNQLQKSYLKSYFPFSEDDTLKITLSTSCAFEVAENYALICKDIAFKSKVIFSRPQKALILINSINAMSRVMLYNALLYNKPGKGFWGLCFLFYLFAKQNDALDFTTDQHPQSFNNIFKQLLVFALSNAAQFNTEDIYTIFSLLGRLGEYVVLMPMVPETKINSVPCIDIRVDAAPAIFKDVIQKPSAYLFYISTANVIKQLFDLSTNNRKISYSHKVMALRLIKALTMSQHRKNERELAENEIIAEVGFDKFTQFLIHKESLLKTKGIISYEVRDLNVEEKQEKDNRDSQFGYRTEVEASLSLAQNPDEIKVGERVENNDIWGVVEEKPELNNEDDSNSNAKIIDKSQYGFCVRLTDADVATKVGDIIHLIITPTSVVTLVRRIISSDHEGVVVGVEVLGYDAELLHIMDIDNEGPKIACVLVNIEGEESIVIKADQFKNEEYLYVDRNDKILRYRIEKILDSSTSTIKHLKVSLS